VQLLLRLLRESAVREDPKPEPPEGGTGSEASLDDIVAVRAISLPGKTRIAGI